MFSIDFLPATLTEDLQGDELFTFILDRVTRDRVLLLEKDLDPEARMLLIARGLERFSDEFIGVKLMQIDIKAESGGFFRSKQLASSLLLVAPGNATIEQSEDGDFSVRFAQSSISQLSESVAESTN